MGHLEPEELVDAAEGRATPASAAHLERCDACRSQAATLRGSLNTVRDVPGLEPSPLAWEHLAARIDRAVREAGSPAPWWMAWGWRWAPALMVVVLAATAAVGVGLWNRRAAYEPAGTAGAASGTGAAPSRGGSGEGQAAEDPAWSLLSDISAGIDLDDATRVGGMAMPGGADRALWQLSDEERRELVSILKAELEEPAAAGPVTPGV